MTADADPQNTAPAKKKGILMPLILGLVLAGAGGGGGFYAVQSGLIGGPAEASDGDHADAPLPPLGPAAFVALDPIVVNLPPGSDRDFLLFTGSLEVAPGSEAEVEALRPRIIDVLNSYLRALELADLESPTALIRLRSQMLRRVQVVSGGDRIRDLLIIEFVIN